MSVHDANHHAGVHDDGWAVHPCPDVADSERNLNSKQRRAHQAHTNSHNGSGRQDGNFHHPHHRHDRRTDQDDGMQFHQGYHHHQHDHHYGHHEQQNQQQQYGYYGHQHHDDRVNHANGNNDGWQESAHVAGGWTHPNSQTGHQEGWHDEWLVRHHEQDANNQQPCGYYGHPYDHHNATCDDGYNYPDQPYAHCNDNGYQPQWQEQQHYYQPQDVTANHHHLAMDQNGHEGAPPQPPPQSSRQHRPQDSAGRDDRMHHEDDAPSSSSNNIKSNRNLPPSRVEGQHHQDSVNRDAQSNDENSARSNGKSRDRSSSINKTSGPHQSKPKPMSPVRPPHGIVANKMLHISNLKPCINRDVLIKYINKHHLAADMRPHFLDVEFRSPFEAIVTFSSDDVAQRCYRSMVPTTGRDGVCQPSINETVQMVCYIAKKANAEIHFKHRIWYRKYDPSAMSKHHKRRQSKQKHQNINDRVTSKETKNRGGDRSPQSKSRSPKSADIPPQLLLARNSMSSTRRVSVSESSDGSPKNATDVIKRAATAVAFFNDHCNRDDGAPSRSPARRVSVDADGTDALSKAPKVPATKAATTTRAISETASLPQARVLSDKNKTTKRTAQSAPADVAPRVPPTGIDKNKSSKSVSSSASSSAGGVPAKVCNKHLLDVYPPRAKTTTKKRTPPQFTPANKSGATSVNSSTSVNNNGSSVSERGVSKTSSQKPLSRTVTVEDAPNASTSIQQARTDDDATTSQSKKKAPKNRWRSNWECDKQFVAGRVGDHSNTTASATTTLTTTTTTTSARKDDAAPSTRSPTMSRKNSVQAVIPRRSSKTSSLNMPAQIPKKASAPSPPTAADSILDRRPSSAKTIAHAASLERSDSETSETTQSRKRKNASADVLPKVKPRRGPVPMRRKTPPLIKVNRSVTVDGSTTRTAATAETVTTTATATPTPIANDTTDSKSIVKKMETAPTKEIEKPPQQSSPNKQLVLIKNMV
eukprot:CAMPEP_0119548562 /NCGR_PEP_ID=MMETSP1352-20130426/2454_1 /TAXON_ID=265584 /ORGANISM="Stauroneis constricta, Strain CCMP1120" /LENGTH=982 /DNA_ID=CAMNT_0007593871 /DNA_START=65 /DNA_END=3010 /DNA_ORIENTATION=-